MRQAHSLNMCFARACWLPPPTSILYSSLVTRAQSFIWAHYGSQWKTMFLSFFMATCDRVPTSSSMRCGPKHCVDSGGAPGSARLPCGTACKAYVQRLYWDVSSQGSESQENGLCSGRDRWQTWETPYWAVHSFPEKRGNLLGHMELLSNRTVHLREGGRPVYLPASCLKPLIFQILTHGIQLLTSCPVCITPEVALGKARFHRWWCGASSEPRSEEKCHSLCGYQSCYHPLWWEQ